MAEAGPRTPVDAAPGETRRAVDVVPTAPAETRRPVDVVPTETRRPVDVAVGVLIDADGRFLLTSRPEGKVYAGHWEFPGGKLEAGESVEAALRRELHEELGIAIGAARAWKTELFDYPHALVRLHFCKVCDWQGAFEMREAQRMAWQTLPVAVGPVLPGTLPVLRWLAEERGFAGPTVGDGDPAPAAPGPGVPQG